MSSGEHWTVFQGMGIPHEYNAVVGSLLVGSAVVAGGLVIRGKLSRVEEHGIPESKVSFVNIMTTLVGAFRSLVSDIIGHHSEKYIPIVFGLFFYIWLCNLMGLIPGVPPPTQDINNNLAMALSVFVLYQFFGFNEHGISYLKQFTGGLPPKGYGLGITLVLSLIAILMVGIELIGHIIRPVSLSLRLWGNINGDHTLVGVFLGIVPLLVPVVFMVLGVFVSTVQALVFSLLTTVYLKLAVSHDH